MTIKLEFIGYCLMASKALIWRHKEVNANGTTYLRRIMECY